MEYEMKVIKLYTKEERDFYAKLLEESDKTLHFEEEREELEQVKGKIVYAFLVDWGHPKGPEIHLINDEAYAYIYNFRTLRKITFKALRKGQLEKYGIKAKWLLDKGNRNKWEGRNTRGGFENIRWG